MAFNFRIKAAITKNKLWSYKWKQYQILGHMRILPGGSAADTILSNLSANHVSSGTATTLCTVQVALWKTSTVHNNQ